MSSIAFRFPFSNRRFASSSSHDERAVRGFHTSAAHGQEYLKCTQCGNCTAIVDSHMSSPHRCSGCNLPLSGQYVTAASRTYHPACFKCSKCRQPISGSFVVAGGQTVCVQCSTASAPSCSGCGGKITEGGFVTVKGLSFHPQHFTCSSCGTGLQSGLGSSSNGVYVFESFGSKPRAMCGSCHASASGRVCFSCSKPIVGQHIVADNKMFHNQCWTCAGCRRELAGMGYHRSFAIFPQLSAINFALHNSQSIAGAATAVLAAPSATPGIPAYCALHAEVVSQ
jgi:hypothetical protein